MMQAAITIALQIIPLERSHTIALPQVAGMGLAFLCVPLTTQLLFLGFLLFSVLFAIGPRLLKYVATDEQIETLLSGATGLCIQSFLVGSATCVLLHVANLLG